MLLVDSHCHLDFPDYGEDREAVLARAAEAGIARMLTIATGSPRFDQVKALAAAHDPVYCTIGVHPHDAGSDPLAADADALEAAARADKVVGIGETGLDYFYENSSPEAQRAAFRVHVEVARRLDLPLVVHSRDADADTIAIVGEAAGQGVRGVIHCFSSGPELARAALDHGFYISLSGIVTFKKAEALREIVRGLPVDRILVETDAPYLAPVPKRGKRNEPALVRHVAAVVAQELGLSPEDFARRSSANFFRLFDRVPAFDLSAAA